MEQANLTIVQNGEWHNINLKENIVIEQDGEKFKTDKFILDGKYIEVVKKFDKVLVKQGKFGDYGLVRAEYQNTEVSFFLNSKRDIDAFDNLGMTGDKVKITGKAVPNQKGGHFLNFTFELQ